MRCHLARCALRGVEALAPHEHGKARPSPCPEANLRATVHRQSFAPRQRFRSETPKFPDRDAWTTQRSLRKAGPGTAAFRRFHDGTNRRTASTPETRIVPGSRLRRPASFRGRLPRPHHAAGPQMRFVLRSPAADFSASSAARPVLRPVPACGTRRAGSAASGGIHSSRSAGSHAGPRPQPPPAARDGSPGAPPCSQS